MSNAAEYMLYAKIGGEFVPVAPSGELYSTDNAGKLTSDHVWAAQGKLFVDRRNIAADELAVHVRRLLRQ